MFWGMKEKGRINRGRKKRKKWEETGHRREKRKHTLCRENELGRVQCLIAFPILTPSEPILGTHARSWSCEVVNLDTKPWNIHWSLAGEEPETVREHDS